jgi:hypothetical protein
MNECMLGGELERKNIRFQDFEAEKFPFLLFLFAPNNMGNWRCCCLAFAHNFEQHTMDDAAFC